jgi:putative transposase
VLAPRDDGWRVSDALWERIEPLLPARPRHPLGCHRRRVPDRDALDAILFVLRSGCQWAALNQTRICSKSSAYRRFREWARAGVFEALWMQLLADPQTTLEWDWLALDSQIVKAPKGGQASGPNPTDRAKSGTKRSLCTDAGGVPLSIAIDGANRHDVKLLERTLEGLLAAPPEGLRPGLCLDRGYDYPWVRPRLSELGYEPHVHSRGEEARLIRAGARARRWVVESTFAWLVLFRRLKISHERLAATRSAFLNLACALITWRASNPVTRSEAAY